MTRRALGWYETDADDETKGRALRQCITDCAAELGEMGFREDDMDYLLDEAAEVHAEALAERETA